MSEQKWYYQSEGLQTGPVSWDFLKAGLRIGKIQETTLVWAEHLPEWVSMGQCLNSKAETPSASPMPTAVPPQSNTMKPRARSRKVSIVFSLVLVGIIALIAVPAFLGQRARARNRQNVNEGQVSSSQPGNAVNNQEIPVPTMKLNVGVQEFCTAYNKSITNKVNQFAEMIGQNNGGTANSAMNAISDLPNDYLNPPYTTDENGLITLHPGDDKHYSVKVKVIDNIVERVIFECPNENACIGGGAGDSWLASLQVDTFVTTLYGNNPQGLAMAARNLLVWIPEWQRADDQKKTLILEQEAIKSGQVVYKGGNFGLCGGVLIAGSPIDSTKPKGQQGIRYVFRFAS